MDGYLAAYGENILLLYIYIYIYIHTGINEISII